MLAASTGQRAFADKGPLLQVHALAALPLAALSSLLRLLLLLLLDLLAQLPDLRFGIALPVPASRQTAGGEGGGGCGHLPAHSTSHPASRRHSTSKHSPTRPGAPSACPHSLVVEALQALQARNLGEVGRQVEQLAVGGASQVGLQGGPAATMAVG